MTEVARIDVTEVDEVWGWESFDPGGRSDDSNDLEFDPGDDPHEPSNEVIFLNLELQLTTQLQRGCVLAIHRPDVDPVLLSWDPTRCLVTDSYQHRACSCESAGSWKAS